MRYILYRRTDNLAEYLVELNPALYNNDRLDAVVLNKGEAYYLARQYGLKVERV